METYGHYLMLIIEDSKAYLFNSSPVYADGVGLRCTLKDMAQKIGLEYKGTVYWKLGWFYRKQLQIHDTCSVWIALIYHIIASDPDAIWENLKTFLSKPKKIQRKELHQFHKDFLQAKSFSIPLRRDFSSACRALIVRRPNTVSSKLASLAHNISNLVFKEESIWPFRKFFDIDGNEIVDIVSLGAPFREQKHFDLFKKIKEKDVKIIGISHYQEFPQQIINPFEDTYAENHPFDYVKECDAWCYCQRNPEEIGLHMEKSLELVESDFAHFPTLLHFLKKKSLKEIQESFPKKYDFIYSCPQDPGNTCVKGWQAHCRNWKLAKKCLPILCTKMGLSGLLIGRNCENELKEMGIFDKITRKDFLPYHEFIEEIASSKFLFIPNISDASPRVATEAMSLNVPVLMNINIVGGFKYVKYGVSGCLFHDEHDVEKCAKVALKSLGAHKHFTTHWGKEQSAKKLGSFLQSLFPENNLPNLITF